MNSKTRLMTLHGSAVDMHPSWLLVLPLAAGSLALGYFPEAVPGISAASAWERTALLRG